MAWSDAARAAAAAARRARAHGHYGTPTQRRAIAKQLVKVRKHLRAARRGNFSGHIAMATKYSIGARRMKAKFAISSGKFKAR